MHSSLPTRFRSHLRGNGKSPKTVQTCGDAIEQFKCWSEDWNGGTAPAIQDVTEEVIEEWMAAQYEVGCSPGTLKVRYGGLKQFFKWAHERNFISTEPFTNLKPPKVPANPPPGFTIAELEAMIAVCDSRTFLGARTKP